MSDRLSPERESEIIERWVPVPIGEKPSFTVTGSSRPGTVLVAVHHAREDVRAFAAELAAVRAERDEARAELAKYVGHEPSISEEMSYLNRCLNAVRAVCDGAEKQATRWEQPLPVPEWVEQVRQAADGVGPEAEPLVVRRVDMVLEPARFDGETETLVACVAETGRPVALLLDDAERARLAENLRFQPEHFGSCHVNTSGHRMVDGHCLYCSKSVQEVAR